MKKLSVILLFAILYPQISFAVSRTWTGSGNWSTTTNWTPNGAPAVGDDLLFSASSTNNSTVDTSSTINALTIRNTYTGVLSMSTSTGATTLIIKGGGFLQQGGTFNMNDFVTQVGGNFTQSGGIINASGTLIFNATSSKSIFVSSTLADVYFDDGLVGYWKLDTPTSTNNSSTTLDSSGYKELTTIVGFGTNSGPSSTVSSTFQFENPRSFAFDNVNDRISVGDVPHLRFERTDPFALSVWHKVSSTSPASNHAIVGKQIGSGLLRGYALNVQGAQAGDPYRFTLINDNAGDNRMQVQFPRTNDVQWHHICVSYNGNSLAAGVTAYEDGVSLTPTVVDDTLSATIVSSTPFEIGMRDINTLPYGGNIDEVRVYKRTLTSTECSDLAKGTQPIPTAASSTNMSLTSDLTLTGDFTLGGGTFTDASSSTSVINSGDTFANDTTVGTVAWSNPANAGASDDVYASITLISSATSNYLKATGFQFGIPTNATIDGIVVETEHKKVGLGNIADNSVKIVKGGTISGTEHASTTVWGTTDAYFNHTTSTTDLWGLTWTPADINASNFGFVISAVCSGDSCSANIMQIDHIRITIYYTLSGGGNNIKVAGDWNNWSSSTAFVSRSSTVTLTGTNQFIQGSGTNFNHLTKNVTSSDTLTFDQKSLTQVSSTLTWNGASGALLSLRSSSSSVQWKVNASGTRSLIYLNVQDSNNINSVAMNCSEGCVNSGNNINWTFAAVASIVKYLFNAGAYVFKAGAYIFR